ncbi:MAG TPA: ectonucleotide pyrophosphatase/phosphodiesterase, partial [Rhizorhapis sp.]|nr:ectonucleotide pyrophosphatase/phosphodiesterase [Rhizorhapis sp.]
MLRSLLLWLLILSSVSTVHAQTRTSENPVTILISIDGFRPDYLERGITPHLNALAAEGARGVLKPSFPTKTFPNHYAIVTGLRPDRNGIVGNSMIDPERPGQMFSLGDAQQSRDPFWWSQAEPIWVTAEKSGIRTATAFWPGSEVAIQNSRPHDWLRFDQAISNAQRVDTVIDWLRRPEAIRPRLVTLYFDAVDTGGHRFGPESAEVNKAIAEVDAAV